MITSDEGIEQELYSYLERVADPGAVPEPDPGLRDGKRRKRHHPKLYDLLKKITMDELMRCSQDLDDTSSAGYDGISPALLKVVMLTTWELDEPRTEDDMHRDGLHAKFNQYCADESAVMGYGEDEAVPRSPPRSQKLRQRMGRTLLPNCFCASSTCAFAAGTCRL